MNQGIKEIITDQSKMNKSNELVGEPDGYTSLKRTRLNREFTLEEMRLPPYAKGFRFMMVDGFDRKGNPKGRITYYERFNLSDPADTSMWVVDGGKYLTIRLHPEQVPDEIRRKVVIAAGITVGAIGAGLTLTSILRNVLKTGPDRNLDSMLEQIPETYSWSDPSSLPDYGKYKKISEYNSEIIPIIECLGNIPLDLAQAIMYAESNGKEDARSKAKAVGLYQIRYDGAYKFAFEAINSNDAHFRTIRAENPAIDFLLYDDLFVNAQNGEEYIDRRMGKWWGIKKDPESNRELIEKIGLAYLSWLARDFSKHWYPDEPSGRHFDDLTEDQQQFVIAAFNSGPRPVYDRTGDGKGDSSYIPYFGIPPFAETIAYVGKVQSLMQPFRNINNAQGIRVRQDQFSGL